MVEWRIAAWATRGATLPRVGSVPKVWRRAWTSTVQPHVPRVTSRWAPANCPESADDATADGPVTL